MKPIRRLTFPQIVRLFSWVGDLLLIAVALVILLAKGGNLTADYALVLILAVFLGGLLPVSVYFVEFLQQRQAARAAEVTAPETLHTALKRLDRLVVRVETAASDASKTTLAARQVPGLLQESTDALHAGLARLDALSKSLKDLPSAEAIAAQAASGPSAPVDLAPVTTLLEQWRAEQAAPPTVDLSQIEQALAALKGIEPPAPVAIDLSPITDALTELRSDFEKALLVREDQLETLAEQLKSLEDMIGDAPLRVPDAPPPPAPAADSIAATNEDAPEPAASGKATPPAKRKRATKKTARKKPTVEPAAPEPEGLFGEELARAGLPEGKASLLVKALIGVNNRLYVRGDPPLHWDHGRPLEAIGIGEWRLDLESLEGPVEVELRLNDEIAAKGAPTVLTPGQIARATPQFPPANEPF